MAEVVPVAAEEVAEVAEVVPVAAEEVATVMVWEYIGMWS